MKRVGLICPSIRVEDAYYKSAEHLFRASGENTGNFAFVQALYNHLSPNVTMFPWFAPIEAVRERCDVLVMACANQLGPHTNLGALADWFDKIDLPILAIGLGAQSPSADKDVEISEGTLRWLQVISAHSPSSTPNIGVRGEFSRRQVESAGLAERATVVGCPSNFLNAAPDLGEVIAQKYTRQNVERIAVAAGFYRWAILQNTEFQLANLVEKTGGIYVVQSQLEMLRLARDEIDLIDPHVFASIHKYTRPDLDRDSFISWCKRYAHSFIDATSWLDAMRKYDFVVGARFHGIMLAIQAGTPGGVVAHDSRTRELCQTMGIPFRDAAEMPKIITESDIPRLFPFDVKQFNSKRLSLIKEYHKILNGAGIKSRHVDKLIQELI